MFKKLKRGTKILTGISMILALLIVAGVIGVVRLHIVSNALHTVAAEETPLVLAAGSMKPDLMTVRNTLEEFKSATSTMSTSDAGVLGKLEESYRKFITSFDRYAGGIIKGGSLENGTVVPKMENAKLAESVTLVVRGYWTACCLRRLAICAGV